METSRKCLNLSNRFLKIMGRHMNKILQLAVALLKHPGVDFLFGIGLPKILLRLPPPPLLFNLLKRPFDAKRKAPKMVLQDKIRGAALHEIDSALLPQCTRNKNEGCSGFFPGYPES